MSSTSSQTVAPALPTDPRFRPGAYITDGQDLYWVQRATGTPMALRANVLVVEDCRTSAVLELDMARVETTCTLVRLASSP